MLLSDLRRTVLVACCGRGWESCFSFSGDCYFSVVFGLHALSLYLEVGNSVVYSPCVVCQHQTINTVNHLFLFASRNFVSFASSIKSVNPSCCQSIIGQFNST